MLANPPTMMAINSLRVAAARKGLTSGEKVGREEDDGAEGKFENGAPGDHAPGDAARATHSADEEGDEGEDAEAEEGLGAFDECAVRRRRGLSGGGEGLCGEDEKS